MSTFELIVFFHKDNAPASAAFVGLFEEVAFRALINDAIVYQFRSFKHVFLLSAVLSSLIFGYVHVMFVPLSRLRTAVTLPRAKMESPFWQCTFWILLSMRSFVL